MLLSNSSSYRCGKIITGFIARIVTLPVPPLQMCFTFPNCTLVTKELQLVRFRRLFSGQVFRLSSLRLASVVKVCVFSQVYTYIHLGGLIKAFFNTRGVFFSYEPQRMHFETHYNNRTYYSGYTDISTLCLVCVYAQVSIFP